MPAGELARRIESAHWNHMFLTRGAGCQHKAWGGTKRNPRCASVKILKARGAGDSRSAGDVDRSIGSRCGLDPSLPLGFCTAIARSAGSMIISGLVPGAYAPGFMLSPAPQASIRLASASRTTNPLAHLAAVNCCRATIIRPLLRTNKSSY